MDDIARDGHIEGIGGVGQGRDVGLLDGDVRVRRELLTGLREHALGVVRGDQAGAHLSNGDADRAGATRAFEDTVVGADHARDRLARAVISSSVEGVFEEVVERGNPIPEQC